MFNAPVLAFLFCSKSLNIDEFLPISHDNAPEQKGGQSFRAQEKCLAIFLLLAIID
jgi:hypothetical protein